MKLTVTIKNYVLEETALAVHWSGLWASTTWGTSSLPSQGARIPLAMQCGQNERNMSRKKTDDVANAHSASYPSNLGHRPEDVCASVSSTISENTLKKKNNPLILRCMFSHILTPVKKTIRHLWWLTMNWWCFSLFLSAHTMMMPCWNPLRPDEKVVLSE